MNRAEMLRCQADIRACPALEWLGYDHQPGIPSKPFLDHGGRRRMSVAVPESFTIRYRERTSGKEHWAYHRAGFLRLARKGGWVQATPTRGGRLLRDGRLPCARLGSRKLVPRSAVERIARGA